jgi:lipopolysaccharide export system protein LptA
MYYDEKLHRIFTIAPVELTDFQAKPEPTKVTATGMDIYLSTETSAAKQGVVKSKVDNISGVDRFHLRNNVRMDLFIDARSGFMATAGGPDKKGTKVATSADQPAKSKVVITTSGPFTYDVQKDFARFEIPYGQSHYPENVEVRRLNDKGSVDQLFSDFLDLQFQRKASNGPQDPADDRSVNLEIQSAHASGRQVTIASDAENLTAFGKDLFYDAQKRRTVLRGSPEMIAMKDGNEIHARELCLQNTEEKGTQDATAMGPGHISMMDKTKGERNIEARWLDELVYKKDGPYNCLTLTGGAAFEDKEHHQKMQAERIKVWLEPPAEKSAKVADNPQGLRPHRLEASGRVSADSAELHIQDPTENLVVWFKDAPARPALPVGPVADDKPQVKFEVIGPDKTPANPPAGAAPVTPTPPAKSNPFAFGPTQGAGKSSDKPKPPIELCARSVVVHVLRDGPKNDLEQLSCEGAIHVHQEPASAEDRGMDIRGETLQLSHHADGGILVVNGNLAQVQFDKMAILGPEVNIDQCANKAWVNGVGAMQMLTETNFEGNKLAKPSELTIHWKEAMFFNGKNAEFRGGIQAEQQTSRLLCEEMQVTFDRPVSLKENDKAGPHPKVDKLLCDKNVQVEEINRESGKLVGYRRLVAPVVDFDNQDGIATAPGPGQLRILQLSDADDPLARPAGRPAASTVSAPKKGQPTAQKAARQPGAAPPQQQLKLTHVRYNDRMQANNKNRTATFYGNVEVVNAPADRPDVKIDIDNPPPGCLYVRCEKLKVYSHVLPNGQKSQEMEATQKVYVRAQEFYGTADVVKYDEEQDRVIFEAAAGGQAALYRVKVAGAEPEPLIGKKIYYWRKTNDFKVENARSLNVAN